MFPPVAVSNSIDGSRWRTLHVSKVMMTDTRHRVIDRPIKILRHQSAGLQKCSMKAGQSLFSLFAHSPTHATRGSRLVAHGSNIALAFSALLRQGF